MAAAVRLARRRAQNAMALSRSAKVEVVMDASNQFPKLDVDCLDASNRFKIVSSFTSKKCLPPVKFRGMKLKRVEKQSISQPDEVPKSFGTSELTLLVDQLDAKHHDFRTLCRRLRKLPLLQLAPVLPGLHGKVLETVAPSALSLFWSSISRRILVNSADFPLLSLAYVLPELQQAGHLAKVSALGKLVRGLARQAAAVRVNESDGNESEMSLRSLLPLLRCCEVLHVQLASSKPRAEGCWAGRLHRTLTRSLPPVLATAPPRLVLPWMEFYAKHGLVDHEHLQVWEEAGKNIQDALLSPDDERRISRLHDVVPLWIAEALPQVAELPSALAALPFDTSTEKLAVDILSQDDAPSDLALTSREASALSPPMYQKSPPVPVLWHTSPENYQRGLSRLGARQLVLALRYVAADGAGTLKNLEIGDDLPAQKALDFSTGTWPRRHRSRSRAQNFVATLLIQLTSRISGVRSGEACSAVKSLASLRKIGLTQSPEAGNALQALLSGPLAGWKVATSLTPSDISLLLEGMASLVADGRASQGDAQNLPVPVQTVARASMEGATAHLLDLAACALQEAGAPPTKLRTMCGAAAVLFAWHRRINDPWQTSQSRHAMQRFLSAAAAAVMNGPHPQKPRLAQPLAVLRAAGDAGAWSSDVFAHLAPMVTELTLGRKVPKLPGYDQDWRPLLPQLEYQKSAWQIEELAETAWLYAQSSSRRPLEGQTAVALALTLLVHLPVLQAGLRTRPQKRHQLPGLGVPEPGRQPTTYSDSVESRLLMFACDASRILRCSSEVLYFQPWRSPKLYPRKSHEAPTQLTWIQHFDSQLAKDSAQALQIMGRWRRVVKVLDASGHSLGARRRVPSERREIERLGSNVLAAYAALEFFESSSSVQPLTGPAKSCLMRAYGQQSLGTCSSNFHLRSQLRLCLRQVRTLKGKHSQRDENAANRPI